MGVSNLRELTYIDMQEAQQCFVGANQLARETAESLARSQRFEVTRNLSDDGYWITSRGWVGQFPLPDGVVLRVAPKVPIRNLFWMLDVAYRLKSFELFKEHIAGVETFPELFERLASIFVSLVELRMRKGLAREYHVFTEPLSSMRGRISLRDRLAHSTSPQLVCEFEEQTADTEDNQLIHWALFVIGRYRLKNPDLTLRLRRLFLSLGSAVSLSPKVPAHCHNRQYTKLTQDYSPIHILCRFFIEHSGPALQDGETPVIPFAVYMPALFEAFIAESLLNQSGRYLVERQYSVNVTSSFGLQFRIDLLLRDVESRAVLGVLDTKYKLPPPTQDDVFQIVAYAVQTGTNRALLIYPISLPKPFHAQVGPVHVSAIGLDLGGLPHPDTSQLLDDITARLAH